MVRNTIKVLAIALAMAALPAVVRAQTSLAQAQNQYWIPEGTEFKLALHTAISSKTSKKGDIVITTLLDPIYGVDDQVVLPKGIRIDGRVQEVHGAAHRGKGGQLYVLFNTLTLPDGQKVAISGSLTEVFASRNGGDGSSVDAEGDLKGGGPSKAKRIIMFGAPAAAGAAAGGVTPAIAAGVGGLLAAYFLPKGKQAELSAGSLIGMRLDRDLTVTLQPQEQKQNGASAQALIKK
ncbi:MAG TPA: TrbI/VirB10 family protein [Terriglobia bacterium]|nr:TrbI/VirB10 family protein [Terriglobia bacterium]